MSQTSVLAGGQPFGIGGQIADSGDADIVSGFSLEPSDQMPFGFGVMQKPGDADGYLLPTGNSGTMEVIGVNVFSHDHVRSGTDGAGNQTGDLGSTGLLPNASLQVMRKGRVVVPVAHTVQPNDRAFCYRVATGSFLRGLWVGSDMGGSYVRDCSSQGVFRSTAFTATDGTTRVAILEVDFTNKAV